MADTRIHLGGKAHEITSQAEQNPVGFNRTSSWLRIALTDIGDVQLKWPFKRSIDLIEDCWVVRGARSGTTRMSSSFQRGLRIRFCTPNLACRV